MILYFSIFILLLVPFLLASSFGLVADFDTNQSLFHKDDKLIVRGNVSYDPDIPFVTVQIFTPGKSTFADFDTVLVDPDGSFTVAFHVGGPTWTSDGDYMIKVTYDGSLEQIVQYRELIELESEPKSEPESAPKSEPESAPKSEPESAPKSEPTSKTELDLKPESDAMPQSAPESSLGPIQEPRSTFTTLKFVIPNFPALDKSPQHYIDRYVDEPAYKSWFDSQFPKYSITDVVGYSQTHVDSFPALDKSPQHYIDRYVDEPAYKSWFDSQFPNESIYNILGYADPVSIPDWIKNNAELWAIGQIDDSAFVTGIKFMIENNIIMISSVSSAPSSSSDVLNDQIPNWVKNSAYWWSQDLISEDEFVESLKFLICQGIMIIK